jgi:hypothetical protein
MTKEERIQFWAQTAEFCAEDNDYELYYIKPWQIRLIGPSYSIDLYPVSEKVNIVGTLEYPIVEDIEEFLGIISL